MKKFVKILLPLLFLSIIAFWVYLKIITTPEKLAWDTIARLLCDDDPEIRSEIALAIGRLEEVSPPDKRGILLLKKAFSDPDEKVRKCAVIAFSKIYTPESFSFLQKGLNDPDWGVRLCSAIPLLGFDSQSAFHTLRQALSDSQSALSAAVALGRFGDPVALRILQDKLDGSDIIAKISAGEVLSATDDEFLSVIKQAIESPDEQARVHAIETASTRKSASFIPILLEIAMEDKDPEIRQKAIETLIKLKTQNSKLK